MRKMFRTLTIAIAVLTLSGCAAYSALEPKSTDVGQRLALTPDRTWSRASAQVQSDWAEVWTIDGPLLNSFRVAAGIESGKPLVARRGEAAKALPVFRKGMALEDMVDLVQSTLANTAGAKDFVPISVRPEKVAGQDAVAFEFTYGTGTAGSSIETDRRALGTAFEADGRLYVLLFEAAEVHYFEKLRPAAEAIIRSARLTGGGTAGKS
ncbi:MAG: hypothetical protein JNN22_14295 [Rhodospirillales bacterium]|nr:hypothetical protein [Rhodospirillales bacterium]